MAGTCHQLQAHAAADHQRLTAHLLAVVVLTLQLTEPAFWIIQTDCSLPYSVRRSNLNMHSKSSSNDIRTGLGAL